MTICDISLETTDIFVHDIHVFSVNENEGFFGVEAAGDDILDIVITVFSVDLLFFLKNSGSLLSFYIYVSLTLVEIFLIICDLNDKRNIKRILQVFGEDKRH